MTWRAEAVCLTKQDALDMLHQWYDVEVATCKGMGVYSSITINVQYPEYSVAELYYKEKEQWMRMEIRREDFQEWIWLKWIQSKAKEAETEESYFYE